MVKKFLLLAGGAALLVSCGGNDNNQVQLQKIDSIVNVKVKQHDAENAAKNDSILKAVEMEKAEAIAKERKEKLKLNEKTVQPPATTPSISVHKADTTQNIH